MAEMSALQILLYLLVIIVCVKPLGWYMARVYEGKSCGLDMVIGPVERFIYRLCCIQPNQEMNWKSYLSAMLWLNLLGFFAVYSIQYFQNILPLNPQHFPAVASDLAFNTAVSFITNTNWQAYSGESSLSYLTQMMGLTVQNFLSAATGMAVLVAFIRGIVRHETHCLGNFWVDIVRSVLYILLPLSLLFAIFLTSQGVIQNMRPYQKTMTAQVIPMGPVASQVAIKQLGTNGGGYFNANAAHPFENPTPLTHFFEMLALMLIPAAFCYTFGVMANNKRQGWAIFCAMFCIFVPLVIATVVAEQQGNPHFTALHIEQNGNMEGKETRFGITNSAFWVAATTATGNGSANASHDSLTPAGGLVPLWLIQLGEVVFGGVGSGLYGMLILVIVTVFVAGLMVGRTPEYLGKKIEPYEMKMASFIVLITPFTVLILTALAAVTSTGRGVIANPGAHGLTEVLYAFSSMTNNNGSAFAGLNANTAFYNILGGVAMLIGRYVVAIAVLAIAGSLVQKKQMPNSLGTLPTDTPLFVVMLISITMIIGALTYLPALALGPIVEQILLWKS